MNFISVYKSTNNFVREYKYSTQKIFRGSASSQEHVGTWNHYSEYSPTCKFKNSWIDGTATKYESICIEIKAIYIMYLRVYNV